ncbi:MAG: sulfotransferase family 2 domain-containing protein [Dongiaceae bacterium]
MESANLAVMWSYKAACTTVIKWVFLQNGLLAEALAYGNWIHKYRLRQYQKSDRYLSRLKRLNSSTFDIIKIVRDPLDRAVSSYIHAYRTGYDDQAISQVLQRPVTFRERFSFREFIAFLEHSDLKYSNPHHRVQVAPVERHVLFRIAPRRIIKIEQGLTSALSELERSFGLPPTDFTSPVFTSDHHTVRAPQHGPAADLVNFPRKGAVPPASTFYDDDLTARVARLYAEDFQRYGYSTDVPQAAAVLESERKVVGSAYPQAQL